MKILKKQRDLMKKWKKTKKGTSVVLRKDSGEEVYTETRSMAWLLPSGMAVIMLNGVSGCYSLERITAA